MHKISNIFEEASIRMPISGRLCGTYKDIRDFLVICDKETYKNSKVSCYVGYPIGRILNFDRLF